MSDPTLVQVAADSGGLRIRTQETGEVHIRNPREDITIGKLISFALDMKDKIVLSHHKREKEPT